MGKKSSYKAIRKVAAALPQMTRQALVTTKLSGQEVIDRGVTEVNGKPVLPGQKYVRKAMEAVPVNHETIMKDMYKKHKHSGVQGYINAVKLREAQLATLPAEMPLGDN
jgi:hypothetical protein